MNVQDTDQKAWASRCVARICNDYAWKTPNARLNTIEASSDLPEVLLCRSIARMSTFVLFYFFTFSHCSSALASRVSSCCQQLRCNGCRIEAEHSSRSWPIHSGYFVKQLKGESCAAHNSDWLKIFKSSVGIWYATNNRLCCILFIFWLFAKWIFCSCVEWLEAHTL